jgi:hypothetical protein
VGKKEKNKPQKSNLFSKNTFFLHALRVLHIQATSQERLPSLGGTQVTTPVVPAKGYFYVFRQTG